MLRIENRCTHQTSSISFDGINKKDTNKISHSAFMNNYRSFLFLYFDRTRFDRPNERTKNEIVLTLPWNPFFFSTFSFFTFFVCDVRLSACIVDVLSSSLFWFVRYHDLSDCRVCLFILDSFIHAHITFSSRILSFDQSQKTQWKMWFAAKAHSLALFIFMDRSLWVN